MFTRLDIQAVPGDGVLHRNEHALVLLTTQPKAGQSTELSAWAKGDPSKPLPETPGLAALGRGDNSFHFHANGPLLINLKTSHGMLAFELGEDESVGNICLDDVSSFECRDPRHKDALPDPFRSVSGGTTSASGVIATFPAPLPVEESDLDVLGSVSANQKSDQDQTDPTGNSSPADPQADDPAEGDSVQGSPNASQAEPVSNSNDSKSDDSDSNDSEPDDSDNKATRISTTGKSLESDHRPESSEPHPPTPDISDGDVPEPAEEADPSSQDVGVINGPPPAPPESDPVHLPPLPPEVNDQNPGAVVDPSFQSTALDGPPTSAAEVSQILSDVQVLGVVCPRCENFNHPDAQYCYVDGHRLVETRVLQHAERPTLGYLRVNHDGTHIQLLRSVVLGRAPDVSDLVKSNSADAIQIDDPSMNLSRSHAIVELRDWGVFLRDDGSQNGTWLIADNGSRRRLESGEEIEMTAELTFSLGPTALTFFPSPFK